jgi:hypothetical protein
VVLYLLMSMIDPIPEAWEVRRVCAGSRLPTFSSVKHCSGTSVSGSEGQCSTLRLSQSGPCLQSLLRERSVGLRPLEGMSAGLSLPGQWLQSWGGTNWRISSTLLCTKAFQSLSTPLIQHRATCESVKHLMCSSSILGRRLWPRGVLTAIPSGE